MSLYVTLASHGAKIFDGDRMNRQNDFRIDLKTQINLPVNKYEVALVEMSFKSFWLVNIGRFTIFKPSKEGQPDFVDLDTDIYVHDGIRLIELIKVINFKTEKFGVKFEYISRSYFKIEIKDNREFVIKGHFASLLNREKEYLEEIRQFSDPSSELASYVRSGRLYTKQMKFKNVSLVKCFIHLNIITLVENLFIYTNIIEDVYISEDKKKLLKIVPVRHAHDFMNNVIITNPHYLPLENDFIEKIRMTVRDARGENIHFIDEFSNVIYKLHFRPKQH